jgi:isocitrate/isopropylmalate dehydrogenase
LAPKTNFVAIVTGLFKITCEELDLDLPQWNAQFVEIIDRLAVVCGINPVGFDVVLIFGDWIIVRLGAIGTGTENKVQSSTLILISNIMRFSV